MINRSGDDRGSVLLLGIGLVVVAVAVLGVGVDLAVLHLRHRQARMAADAAARAAAQALDLDAYYTGGVGGRLPLDEVAARQLAAQYARRIAPNGWRISSFLVVRATVTVELQDEVRLPFTGLASGRDVVVRGSGSAQLHALPVG